MTHSTINLDSNLEQKKLSLGFFIHPNASTSMEHAPFPLYAHVVFQMSLRHWVKFKPKKLCPNLKGKMEKTNFENFKSNLKTGV
jgi:hypothetical protein